MRHRANRSNLRKYYYVIGICLILILLIEGLKSNPQWVEQYYAQKFYPALSYLYIILFSWIPFSVGDVFYAIVALSLSYHIIQFIRCIVSWNKLKVKKHLIIVLSFLSVLYVIFYVNWGLHYFRIPIAQKLELKEYKITKEEHLKVLDKYIQIANEIREKIDVDSKTKPGVKGDLTEIVLQDTLLDDYLCKTQVRVKSPLSNELSSYFTVSGYFNPFTLEVQVNEFIPNASYPFVHVHEMAHQMGVGFEDECNFIAFLTLMDNEDLWYKYSAYYSAVEYLLQPLYGDKVLFDVYKAKLSPKVLTDFHKERAFWMSYRSWVDKMSSVFYEHFLKHNNQPEGLERYSMMTTLLVAWEKQQEKLP